MLVGGGVAAAEVCGLANQGPMKAVKRIGSLRLDKLPQSPRGAVPKCPAMLLLSLATALF